jgi:hypothetical protein
MKKSRPKNRPGKARIPRERQAAPVSARLEELARDFAARFGSVERVMEALVEAVGRENVRRASAKLGSARSLAALAGHVANGKLVEAQVVSSPGSAAVEFSESTSMGEVLTESVVAGLADISPEQAAPFVGKRVGEIFDVGEHKIQVRRVWDVVPQAVAP